MLPNNIHLIFHLFVKLKLTSALRRSREEGREAHVLTYEPVEEIDLEFTRFDISSSSLDMKFFPLQAGDNLGPHEGQDQRRPYARVSRTFWLLRSSHNEASSGK